MKQKLKTPEKIFRNANSCFEGPDVSEIAICVGKRPISTVKQSPQKIVKSALRNKNSPNVKEALKNRFSPITELEENLRKSQHICLSNSPIKNRLLTQRGSFSSALKNLGIRETSKQILSSVSTSPKQINFENSPTKTCPATPAIVRKRIAKSRFSDQKRCSVQCEPVMTKIQDTKQIAEFEEKLKTDLEMARFFDRSYFMPTIFTDIEDFINNQNSPFNGSKTNISWHYKACELYEKGEFCEAIEKWEPAFLHNKTFLPIANNYALANYMAGSGYDLRENREFVFPSQNMPHGNAYFPEKAYRQKEGYRMIVQISLLYQRNMQLLFNKAILECHMQKYSECLETLKDLIKLKQGKFFEEQEIERMRAICFAGKGFTKKALKMYEMGENPLRISAMHSGKISPELSPKSPLNGNGTNNVRCGSSPKAQNARKLKTALGTTRRKIACGRNIVINFKQRDRIISRENFTRNMSPEGTVGLKINSATVLVREYLNQSPHESKYSSKIGSRANSPKIEHNADGIPHENNELAAQETFKNACENIQRNNNEKVEIKQESEPNSQHSSKIEVNVVPYINSLSYVETANIIKEMTKTFQPKNYEIMDEVLGKKTLLKYLPKTVRMGIYPYCQYLTYKANSVIPLQDRIYILIKGSAIIQVFKKNAFGANLLKSKTKYEGDHFVQGSVLEPGERSIKIGIYKECKASEDVMVIGIEKEHMVNVVKNSLYTLEVKTQAKFLASMALFHVFFTIHYLKGY